MMQRIFQSPTHCRLAKKLVARSFATDVATTLPKTSNQALGIAEYAIDFIQNGNPNKEVLHRTAQLYTDANLCGLSALSLRTNAPTVLRKEALSYECADGVSVMGSNVKVQPEKAILANCSAVREWDSNGTNFGYNPKLGPGHVAGEFGHNDFYNVAVAAAQLAGKDGATALKAMVAIDEIRGRLSEVFSLKTYKIDHVVHGAIGSAAVYGALMGATPKQIESAIGMVVSHYIPFRAIRAGKQLSDSKGASAAVSTEAAIIATRRAMNGFVGPADIFRNPEAIFRLFEGPGKMGVSKYELHDDGAKYEAPFNLVLSKDGSDFACMGMHFKLGLYEHQSAGAIQGVMNLLHNAPQLLVKGGAAIKNINIVAYEPAFGIIGDPAKKEPTTRQSADHSMAYIISTLINKAIDQGKVESGDQCWKDLMLSPYDYDKKALYDPVTRSLMDKITFTHGGKEYDDKYPDGIPTSVVITGEDNSTHDSGLVMYPSGHARAQCGLEDILNHKFNLLGGLCTKEPQQLVDRFMGIGNMSAAELKNIQDFEFSLRDDFEDA